MKKIILSALMLAGLTTFAQEESKLSISGSVDVYGTTNFAKGEGTPGILIANPETAGAFGLGMANTIFSYEGEKSGVVADLAFGPRANDANLAGAINQLYAYYNFNEKTTITAGQFNTFLGYEVISPVVNFNYTVSYLFNAGPFSHTGVKLDYAASEDLSFLVAITNPHGLPSIDEGNYNGNMQYGGQIGYKGQYLNLLYGADGFATDSNGNIAKDALYVDYTGGFNASESFFVGINAAYHNSSKADFGYSGAALYLENTFSDAFALGLRPEYFQVKTAGETGNVTAFTLTANTTLDENFKLITEFRYDASKDGLIEGAFEANVESVPAITAAMVYSF